MLCFPQLLTGATAQYPAQKTTVTRSVVNSLPDDSAIFLADPDAGLLRWTLRFGALSDVERGALESFYLAAAGPLRTFTFLDPAGNLLRWSEDLTRDIWIADGLLQVAADRLVNTAQIPQGIEQRIMAPGAYTYCFSAFVRSGAAILSMRNNDGSVSSAAGSGLVWCSGSIPGEAEEIRCRVETGPGAVVELGQLLLQAQPMPGSYRITTASSGVYAQTRFAEERLQFTAEGPDLHSTTVRLISRPGVQV